MADRPPLTIRRALVILILAIAYRILRGRARRTPSPTEARRPATPPHQSGGGHRPRPARGHTE